jgi:hypothetical protein
MHIATTGTWQVRVEHLNRDAQFLQPPLVKKRGVGPSPMTRQHRMLLDDLGGDIGNAPERASNTRGWKYAISLRHFSPYLYTVTFSRSPIVTRTFRSFVNTIKVSVRYCPLPLAGSALGCTD